MKKSRFATDALALGRALLPDSDQRLRRFRYLGSGSDERLNSLRAGKLREQAYPDVQAISMALLGKSVKRFSAKPDREGAKRVTEQVSLAFWACALGRPAVEDSALRAVRLLLKCIEGPPVYLRSFVDRNRRAGQGGFSLQDAEVLGIPTDLFQAFAATAKIATGPMVDQLIGDALAEEVNIAEALSALGAESDQEYVKEPDYEQGGVRIV